MKEADVRALFPDALSVITEEFGFRVRVPYRDHVYVVVWRYDAVPKERGQRLSLIEYLRFVGETLPARSAAHFPGGLVHRRPA